MAEKQATESKTAERKKSKQVNFRLPDDLAEQFDSYCKARGLSLTQFLENSIRQALGQPLTIPSDALGVVNSQLISGDIKPDASQLDEIKAEIKQLASQLADVQQLASNQPDTSLLTGLMADVASLKAEIKQLASSKADVQQLASTEKLLGELAA
jgi:hypothetical protein